jgi:hypothetical protein
MSWIDDCLAERKAAEDRDTAIESAAHNIYEELWEEILRNVAEARKKRIPVFTNGEPSDRVVGLSDVSSGNQKSIHIKLGRDRHSIVADGISFNFDVCPDGVVCIRDKDGIRLSVQDTAIRILKPFLFPESKTNH